MSSEERRASIIDTACRLFAEKGFRGTTTRELAAAVGVTEPVLYEHFKTKRELYSAIIEQKAQAPLHFMNVLRETHAERPDDVGFFTTLGNAVIDWYTQDLAFTRLLLFSSLEGHELKDLFHQKTNVCFAIVTEYLDRRMKEGAMRTYEPALAAKAFFGMVAHYALTCVAFGYPPLNRPSTEVVADMVKIFLGGMYEQEKAQ